MPSFFVPPRAVRSRRARPPARRRSISHAVATWSLLLVYLFATACAVWDVLHP